MRGAQAFEREHIRLGGRQPTDGRRAGFEGGRKACVSGFSRKKVTCQSDFMNCRSF